MTKAQQIKAISAAYKAGRRDAHNCYSPAYMGKHTLSYDDETGTWYGLEGSAYRQGYIKGTSHVLRLRGKKLAPLLGVSYAEYLNGAFIYAHVRAAYHMLLLHAAGEPTPYETLGLGRPVHNL